MKTRLFIIGLFAFVSSACLSQDVITYKNGKEAKGTVTDVTTTDIKFKKEDNPDGPIYVVSKSEIFMIRYANGSKDVFGEKQISTVVEVKEKKNQPLALIIHIVLQILLVECTRLEHALIYK